ncbi:MAG: SsrA-binding protein SmpB [Chloroflexi bacterium]|nr:SsrA-binding protein SmpB [Chloroflexota bacterium]
MARTKEKPHSAEATSDHLIAVNRRARHDYEVLESLEAGLVLTGTEIKSLRAGRVSLQEAFAKPERGAVWLYGVHIPPYAQGNVYNHEPTRPRKLLLHRDQILVLTQKVEAKGLTLVPLRLYITRHRAKIELAVARGRKVYDKREAVARRDVEREMQRALQVRA